MQYFFRFQPVIFHWRGPCGCDFSHAFVGRIPVPNRPSDSHSPGQSFNQAGRKGMVAVSRQGGGCQDLRHGPL